MSDTAKPAKNPFAGLLAGAGQARKEPAALEPPPVEVPAPPSIPVEPTPLPRPIIERRGPGRPRGKRSDPNFAAHAAYLPRKLHRATLRALADEAEALDRNPREFSELVAELLTAWLADRPKGQ